MGFFFSASKERIHTKDTFTHPWKWHQSVSHLVGSVDVFNMREGGDC